VKRNVTFLDRSDVHHGSCCERFAVRDPMTIGTCALDCRLINIHEALWPSLWVVGLRRVGPWYYRQFCVGVETERSVGVPEFLPLVVSIEETQSK